VLYVLGPGTWGPPSLLHDGYRVFPGGKVRPGRGVDQPPHLVPRLKKEQSVPLLPLWAFMACSRVNFTLVSSFCTCNFLHSTLTSAHQPSAFLHLQSPNELKVLFAKMYFKSVITAQGLLVSRVIPSSSNIRNII